MPDAAGAGAAAVEAVAVVAVNPSDHAVSPMARETRWSELPALGVGLGYRDAYRSDVFAQQQHLDFLEIVADHFFHRTPAQTRQLSALSATFTLIPHGLALSLGSAEGCDQAYLKQLITLIDAVQPPWWSEHISFTRAGGIDIGHLTALPKTRESLDVLKRNIAVVKQATQVPLLLENITESIRYPGTQLDDAEFLSILLQENDCGLLLDVTNLYANSINYNFDPLPVLWQLPKDRIVQLHVVGGHWEQGRFIDSHSAPISKEIWSLVEEVCKYAAVKGIILERDERLPPIEELIDELKQARDVLARCGGGTKCDAVS